jgi:serine/threonine protein kinase
VTTTSRTDAGEPFTPPFQIGEIVGGKYEILNVIGVGSIGFVVSAKRIDLGDEVALKFLRPEYLFNGELVSRFAREARIAVSIRSEHIVRVFDVGVTDTGAPFMVMERLDGRDLGRVLQDTGRLASPVAVDYVLHVCEALATAHAKGIVHRDVKPENLFLSRLHGTDIIKVLDFGVSKVALTGSPLDNAAPLVRTATPLGSPLYMSPEQVRACPDVDARADIWGVGCVLYELVVGAPAFDAPSLMQICALILESDPLPPKAIHPAVAADLLRVIERCLQKDPAHRFQSAADLATALAPFAADQELARNHALRCSHVLHEMGRSTADSRESGRPPSSVGSHGGLSVSIAPPSVDTVDVPATMFRRSWNWRAAALGTVAVGSVAGWLALRPSPQGEALPATRPTAAASAASAATHPGLETRTAPAASNDARRPKEVGTIAEPPKKDLPRADPPRHERSSAPPRAPAVRSSVKEKDARQAPKPLPSEGVSGEPDVGF